MKHLFIVLFLLYTNVLSISLEKIFTITCIEIEEELEELNKAAQEFGLSLSFRKIGDTKELEAIIDFGETILIIPRQMLDAVYSHLNLEDEYSNRIATVRVYGAPSEQEIDELEKKLELYPDLLDRQLIILDFFCTRYALSHLPV